MKQSGNIFHRAWHDCERCGFSFPLSKLIRQNGMLVCRGAGTTNCADEQGHDYYVKRTRLPRREGYDEEPKGNEVIE